MLAISDITEVSKSESVRRYSSIGAVLVVNVCIIRAVLSFSSGIIFFLAHRYYQCKKVCGLNLLFVNH